MGNENKTLASEVIADIVKEEIEDLKKIYMKLMVMGAEIDVKMMQLKEKYLNGEGGEDE